MAHTTHGRPPEKDWDDHRETITELYQTRTFKDMVKTMKDQHHFEANRSQFHAHLQRWGVRKNLTPAEWKPILARMDRLDADGIPNRVLISGMIVSTDQVQRARRYAPKAHAQKDPHAPSNRSACGSGDIYIETKRLDGRWERLNESEDIIGEDSEVQIESSDVGNGINPTPGCLGVESAIETTAMPEFSTVNDNGGHGALANKTTCESPTDFLKDMQMDQSPSPFDLGEMTFQSGLESPDPRSSHRSTSLFSLSGVLGGSTSLFALFGAPGQITSPLILDGMNLDFHEHMDDIALQHAESDLMLEIQSAHNETQGAAVTSPSIQIPSVTNATRESLCNNLENLNVTSQALVGNRGLATTEHRANMFEHLPFTVIDNFLQSKHASSPGHCHSNLISTGSIISGLIQGQRGEQQQLTHIRLSIERFLTVLPGEPRPDDLISPEDIFETEFTRLLLFSLVNGFAGLSQIPVQKVMKHLSRIGNTNSLYMQLIEVSPEYLARSLADSIFRAAIEANATEVIQRILAVRRVDANNTPCFADGEKYTPVERAAYLVNLRMVEFFCAIGVDLNKTFHPAQTHGGALSKLLSGLRERFESKRGEISPLLIQETVDILIQAKAQIWPATVGMLVWRSNVWSETVGQLVFALVYLLLRHSLESSPMFHVHYIKSSPSRLEPSLLEPFNDTQAMCLARVILAACESTGCKSCWSKRGFREEVVHGAREGHLEFVKLVADYIHLSDDVLVASILSRNNELIDFVLKQVNIPRNDTQRYIDLYDTPLSAAITTGNHTLALRLEESGPLQQLSKVEYCLPLIKAASVAGNMYYFKMALSAYGRERDWTWQVADALTQALTTGHEDVIYTLLEFDAYVTELHVYEACRLRNSKALRAFLDANLVITDPEDLRNEEEIEHLEDTMEQAILWGDRSVIEALTSTFTMDIVPNRSVISLLQANEMDMVRFLSKRGALSEDNLASGLEYAIERREDCMVREMIHLGAFITPDHLALAAKAQPCLLELLTRLGTTNRWNAYVMPALRLVTMDGNLEAMDVLLGLNETRQSNSQRGKVLFEAIQTHKNRHRLVERLLGAGWDANTMLMEFGDKNFIKKDVFENKTALLKAIDIGETGIAQLLIDHGASVNREAVFRVQRTPLQRAAELGDLKMVKLLLDNNADANGKAAWRTGGTALQFAAISGNVNIAAELLKHGADKHAPPSKHHGRWPLEGAAEHGRLDMIALLWGASPVGFPAEQCSRAMELAKENGHMGCRMLISELSGLPY